MIIHLLNALTHWVLDHIKMWSGTTTLDYVFFLFWKKWALSCHSWMLRWFIGIILGKIFYESSNWQHIQRLKITILGAHWQLLERIAKIMFIFYFVYTKHQVSLNCNENKDISVASWTIEIDFFLDINYVVFILNGLTHWEWRPHYIYS